MKSLHTADNLLDAIHKRPAMFWGGGKYPFTELVSFLSGYRLGFETAVANTGVCPTELIPPGFNEFVARRLGVKLPTGGKDWAVLIEEKTCSQEEAFELFFELRREHRKE